ncbi:MAG: hypothetical protein KGZ52_02745 [Xanthomonadaceae bacterium]|nr:hypothetical protein [Xanthomonadaceae bacterium]
MMRTVNGAPQALKTPGSVVDFGVDWRQWLALGETITSSTWACEPALSLTNPGEAEGVAVVWVGGGVEGTTYRLRNSIVTTAGRIDSREIVLTCTARRG